MNKSLINNVDEVEIVNKRKSITILFHLLLILAFIILLNNRAKLSYENNLLKNKQGEMIQRNLSYISDVVYDSKRDLADNNLANLIRYNQQFNEFTMLQLPQKGFSGYLINIRNDFQELIKLNEKCINDII
ncbi:MAG: hypothetical protein K0R54_1345 [Clostridiaceae bacterium]|jgi:hypothetical protein|nr:hypothetical protein [Clostridiaceae bacterium]